MKEGIILVEISLIFHVSKDRYCPLTYLYKERDSVVSRALKAEGGEVEEMITPSLTERGVG